LGGSGIGLEVVGSLSEGILLVLCEAAVMRVRLRACEGTLAVDASESGGAASFGFFTVSPQSSQENQTIRLWV